METVYTDALSRYIRRTGISRLRCQLLPTRKAIYRRTSLTSARSLSVIYILISDLLILLTLSLYRRGLRNKDRLIILSHVRPLTMMMMIISRMPSCRWGGRATAYIVPVAVRTFKVIQGQ